MAANPPILDPAPQVALPAPDVRPAIDSHGKGAASARPAPSSHDDEIGDPPAPPRVHFLLLLVFALGVAAILAGMFTLGYLPKSRQQAVLEQIADHVKHAAPKVTLVKPRQSPATGVVQLPGDAQPLEETSVYARTNGYLRRWLVDIGDEVTGGQLLAEIDTPEVDQELRQAKAAVGQTRAKQLAAEETLKLNETTFRRYESLAVSKAVNQQDIDERRAAVDTASAAVEAAKADVAAGQANVQRLTETQAFAKVYAPFAGTITSRTIETGGLVSVGGNSSQALFHLAKTNPLRVYVNVPQIYSAGIQPGQTAELLVRDRPGRKFIGKIMRTAKSIDTTSRTLLTEVQIANDDHALLPGSYVQVKLSTVRENPPLLVPAAALIVNADGTQVATVDDQLKVHFQAVEVEGDFGAEIGIANGLSVDARVVANPGERLTEGGAVLVDEAKKPETPAPVATNSNDVPADAPAEEPKSTFETPAEKK